MIRLTRSDPSRNMHRFYAMQLWPTLFGEWALVAEWGRIGSPGKMMRQAFQTEELAQTALEKRIGLKAGGVTCLNVLYIPFREATPFRVALRVDCLSSRTSAPRLRGARASY